MHPILVQIGPITIHAYGFLLAVGVLSAVLLSMKLAKKAGVDTQVLMDFIFYTVFIGLIGAKIFLFVTDYKEYISSMDRMKDLLFSGGTFFGGLIIGGIFGIWFLKRKKMNLKVIMDIMGPSMALAHFFGRMGCFAAGCCWGRVAEGCPIAMEFNHPETTTGVPRHLALYPTQLIESLLNLLNFIFLIIVYKKKKFDGQVFAIYLFNYSIIRFCVEFFRGDEDRGYVFGGLDHPFSSLSVPQLICLLGIVTAIILFYVFKKNARQQPAKKN